MASLGQLRSQIRGAMAIAKGKRPVYISPTGQVQHLYDKDSMWEQLKVRSRSVTKLKGTSLWQVLKELIHDKEMWEKPNRYAPGNIMPKNTKGAGGGRDRYGYDVSSKGKQIVMPDIRGSAGFRVYSKRPFPPVMAKAMTWAVGLIIKLWIVRGN